MLSAEFKPLGYKVCTKSLPGFFLSVGSWFSKMAKELNWNRGKRRTVLNNKSIDVLGMEYRDINESVVEMGHNLIDQGYLEDKR